MRRIAASTAHLGLPEVILGVVPGSGGTQRLPRLVGMKIALSMISTGRQVGAAEALDIGLIDEQEEDPLAAALALSFPDLNARLPISKLPRPKAEPEAAEAALVKSQRRMPRQSAPGEAVRLIGLAASHDFDDGLQAERAAFLKLRDGDECRALRHIFFAERGARAPAHLKGISTSPLENIVVIGGGTMGAGIAHALARAGSTTTLIECDDKAIHAARLRMSGLYEAAVKRGLITAEAAIEEQSTIRYQAGYGDRAGCLSDPSRLVGLHFFSPAHIMKLLEIVKGVQTSDYALATGYALAKHLRKIPVEVGVCDGFVGNRMLQRVREAAELLLLDGAEPVQIDRAMRGFGYSMGLYETQDMSGLDIAWANRRRQEATRDPERRYSKVQDQVCEAGWLGRKAGLGWYEYEDDKLIGPNPSVSPLIEAEAARHGISRRELSDKAILQTLMLALINEAANILDEGIAWSASDIDLVLVHGYGFPRFRGGPLHYADQLGIQRVREGLEILNKGDSVIWRISPLILKLADTNGSFGERRRSS